MDTTKEDIHIYNLNDATADTITLSSLDVGQTPYTLDPGYGAVPTAWPWVTTTNGTSRLTWANISDPATTVEQSGRLQLRGENADIEINGESLMDMIRGIEQRLNIMRPNPELEAEWDQLRELGEQYRELEKKLQEQSDMWNTLKKMPPPDIK
jgi:hypothetical protein